MTMDTKTTEECKACDGAGKILLGERTYPSVKKIWQPCIECTPDDADTKTTEWEKRFEERFDIPVYQAELIAEQGDRDWKSMKEFIRRELHQSRTDLMRKVVGVVGKKLCPFHTEYNNCCNECAMFLPHNLNHSALIKLAEEEGIEL